MEDTNPLLYFLQSIKNPLVTGKSTVARGFILLICSRGARDIYPLVTVLKSIQNYGLKAFPSRGTALALVSCSRIFPTTHYLEPNLITNLVNIKMFIMVMF